MNSQPNNLSHTLLEALKQHGAREMFGIPGDFVLAFFQQAIDAGILPLYTLSHEPAVGFAADASARFHTRLGVAVVTYGAGALNMVNAVARVRPRPRRPRSRRRCCSWWSCSPRPTCCPSPIRAGDPERWRAPLH